MSLLNPKQIHEVLTALAPAPPPQQTFRERKSELSQLLSNSNLTAEEVLDNLSSLMRSAEADSVRLGAAKLGLELNKLLGDDEVKANFSVTINIIDNQFNDNNPILIPRV